jgi:hypothetical protein
MPHLVDMVARAFDVGTSKVVPCDMCDACVQLQDALDACVCACVCVCV